VETLARFINEGGVFMWWIGGILAFAIAIIIERTLFFYYTCKKNGSRLVTDIAKHLNDSNYSAALKLLENNNSPLNNILTIAVKRFSEGFIYEDIQQGVEEISIKELPRFGKRINYLGLFANIATLTGLLGTIFGLQQSFSSLATAEASEKAAMLAAGISQAMNTTAMGLMVAIPCMIAFTQLSNIQSEYIEEVDEATVKLLNYLEKKKK